MGAVRVSMRLLMGHQKVADALMTSLVDMKGAVA